jgi:hypothetical protein
MERWKLGVCGEGWEGTRAIFSMSPNILHNYMTKRKVGEVRNRLDFHGGVIFRKVMYFSNNALLERIGCSLFKII